MRIGERMARGAADLGARALRLLGLPFRRGTIQIVIYGRYTRRWTRALNGTAAVWPLLKDVRSVKMVRSGRPIVPARGLRQIVVPLLERDALALPAGATALCPEPAAIAILADKARFARYVGEAGLAAFAPASYESGETAVFPCVLKRTNLNASQGIAVVSDQAELAQRLAQKPWAGQPTILQELLEGASEYCTHMVCRDGAMVWTRTYRYPLPGPRTVRMPRMMEALERVEPSEKTLAVLGGFLAPLAYSGPVNLAYKYRADGRPAVFEINPRLGASLMLPQNLADLRDCLAATIAAARPMRC